MDKVTSIIGQYQVGLISEAEARAALEGLRVRGSFAADRSYRGYDYEAQVWVEVDSPELIVVELPSDKSVAGVSA